jgi:sulfatase modifying factor 1
MRSRRTHRGAPALLAALATLAASCGARTGVDLSGAPASSSGAGQGSGSSDDADAQAPLGGSSSSAGTSSGSAASSGATSGGFGGAVTCDAPQGDCGIACANGDCPGLPPSCAPGGNGLTDCGAVGSESCCTSLEVTGGTFSRTYSYFGSSASEEADPASVSSFALDKYEVTVGRFRQFVKAWSGGAGWTPPAGSGRHAHLNGGQGLVNIAGEMGSAYETGWLASNDAYIVPTDAHLACGGMYTTWTSSPGSNEDLPINCVSWYEAYAFCIWDGGFLPSETEWEYAAAGGNQERKYPWGNTDPGSGNDHAIYNCYFPPGDAGAGFAASGACTVAPVGRADSGEGLWGQVDLAGNVSEWTLDWWAAYETPCTDCANLAAQPPDSGMVEAGGRVSRGGDFTSPKSSVLSAWRDYGGLPASHYYETGFRCARAP